jgi:hypothetical protein
MALIAFLAEAMQAKAAKPKKGNPSRGATTRYDNDTKHARGKTAPELFAASTPEPPSST